MLSRKDERLFRALHRRRFREEARLFLAEGVRVVEELAASSIDLELALISTSLEDDPRGRALAESLARRARIERVQESVIERLAATEAPQGVLVAARVPAAPVEEIRFGGRAVCLLLDAVQDPGNFGTLVRNADAFGAAAVITMPGTVDPWNPKAVRAAAGSSFRVPILQQEWPEAVAWLRGESFRFLAADARGQPAETLAPALRVALIVGNEGAGLGPEARAAAESLVAVPTRGPAESLNVAVAAGVLLYMLTRNS